MCHIQESNMEHVSVRISDMLHYSWWWVHVTALSVQVFEFSGLAAYPHAACGGVVVFMGCACHAAKPTSWLHPNLSPQIRLEVSLAVKDDGASSSERETKDGRSEKKSTCLLRGAMLMKDWKWKTKSARLTQSLQRSTLLTNTLLWLPTATATNTHTNQPSHMVNIYRQDGQAQSLQLTGTFCFYIYLWDYPTVVYSVSWNSSLRHSGE